MLPQNESPYRLAFKNAVAVDMPKYLLKPDTLMKNEQSKLGLAKEVDFKKEIREKRVPKTINTNQKFGYHKDTPFFVQDSATGKAAMEFHASTKAVFSMEGKVVPNNPSEKPAPIPNKIFMKMLNQGTSPENQKKVMLLFNKNAQQNLIKQEELAKKNGVLPEGTAL